MIAMISSLYQRSLSNRKHNSTSNYLATYASRDKVSFVALPKIISPHRSHITTLDVDNTNEGRFLLCGSRDGTISVYDLSLLGSDYYINQEGHNHAPSLASNYYHKYMQEEERKWAQQLTFHPICHSQKASTNPSQNINAMNHDPNYLPSGHCCPVTEVKWFTIDSGIFLSSDCIGNILVWDTNSFMPASCMSLSKTGFLPSSSSTSPGSRRNLSSFGASGWDIVSSCCSINSFDLPKNPTHHMQLAVGLSQTNSSLSKDGSTMNNISLADDRAVYLCDIKSGATTQQLIGHGSGHGKYGNRGISTVQWSPVDEFILVSSGSDGCIKVWDGESDEL